LTPQTILFCCLGLLALLALVPILLPLCRRNTSSSVGSAPLPVEEGAALWLDQRAELDESLSVGVIDSNEHHALASALTQAAKSDLDGSVKTPALVQKQPAGRRLWLAALLIVVVGVLTVPLYAKLGSPNVAAELAASAQSDGSDTGTPAAADPQVAAMVQALAKKMQDHPEDPKGWNLLGRSYMVLRDYPDSVKAYRRAAALLPNDANVMADLADALAMANGGRLNGEPATLIARALGADPNNLKVLELAGSAALQNGDPAGAKDYWKRLRAQLQPGSEDAQQVDAAIAQIDRAIGGDTGKGPAENTEAPPTGLTQSSEPAPLPGNAPAAVAAAGTNVPPSKSGAVSVDQIRDAQVTANQGPTISGSVDISPAMAGQVSLTDVVYLSARAVGDKSKGPSIPLAVMRLEARQLPATFTLSDSMAMDSSHKLSDATEVVIEAHIAKHGTPITTPGDLAAKPLTAKLGGSGVNLVIDHVVP
jgi:cytochrome c-type biogenesis protein CcmH